MPLAVLMMQGIDLIIAPGDVRAREAEVAIERKRKFCIRRRRRRFWIRKNRRRS